MPILKRHLNSFQTGQQPGLANPDPRHHPFQGDEFPFQRINRDIHSGKVSATPDKKPRAACAMY